MDADVGVVVVDGERWHDRPSHTGPHHRLHRGIVAEAERVVGDDSGLLEAFVDHPLHGLDAGLSDQRLAAEVVGSYRGTRRCAERREDDERVVTQHLDRQPGIVGDVDGEREVGLVGQHIVDQFVEVVGFGETHVDVGRAIAHSRQHVRHQLCRRRLERAHDQATCQSTAKQLELLVHPVDAGECAPGMFEHHSPGGGQLGRTWPPLAVEECNPGSPFQLADLLADRRLREAELLRCRGERPGLDDRDQRRQLARISMVERGH